MRCATRWALVATSPFTFPTPAGYSCWGRRLKGGNMDGRVKVLIGVTLASAGVLGAWQLIWAYPVRFGALADTGGSRALLFVYGYAVTLVGVVMGSAYRNLQERKGRGEGT